MFRLIWAMFFEHDRPNNVRYSVLLVHVQYSDFTTHLPIHLDSSIVLVSS